MGFTEKAFGSELYKSWIKSVDITSNERITEQFGEYLNVLNEYIALLRKLANISQEHIDDFISGYLMLQQNAELMVDPSKPTNFFYDEEKGFTFIDLQVQSKNINKEFLTSQWTTNYIIMLLLPRIPSLYFYQENYRRNGIFEYEYGLLTVDSYTEIVRCINEILSKLRVGFSKNHVAGDIVENEISKRLSDFSFLNQIPQCNNEQELFEMISQRLNAIIVVNMQNPDIKMDKKPNQSMVIK